MMHWVVQVLALLLSCQVCAFVSPMLQPVESKDGCAYELAIAAIFQNEGPYLKEWIEFHKLVGVQHFYLYNNNSTDHFYQVLNPYIEKGEVSLVDWKRDYSHGDGKGWGQIQCEAYNHCLSTYGSETQWLAVIDTDEFLFCPTGELLTVFLKRYSEFGGLGANWLMFGTSYIEEIPHGFLMIELLTRCAHPDFRDNLRIKSIVQPKYASNFPNPHYCIYKKGKYCVDALMRKIKGWDGNEKLLDQIRINHYWTRNNRYFQEKKIPSRVKRRQSENRQKLTDWAENFNASTNTDILQYVPLLKLKVF